MTFSIVACDAHAAQLGVAVASQFLAVGGVLPALEGRWWDEDRLDPVVLAHLRTLAGDA